MKILGKPINKPRIDESDTRRLRGSASGYSIGINDDTPELTDTNSDNAPADNYEDEEN